MLQCGEMIAVVAEEGEDWKEVASHPIDGGASSAPVDVPVQSSTGWFIHIHYT